jgi:hypothetical protein
MAHPTCDSLTQAASELRAAVSNAQTRAAARTACLALEFHLDWLAQRLSGARALDPALYQRAAVAEGRLRRLLQDFWAFQESPADSEFNGRKVSGLAPRLERASMAELDLLLSELEGLPALD